MAKCSELEEKIRKLPSPPEVAAGLANPGAPIDIGDAATTPAPAVPGGGGNDEDDAMLANLVLANAPCWPNLVDLAKKTSKL